MTRARSNGCTSTSSPTSAGALAERLAMTGTEVERVEHHGVGALENFMVGRVLEAEQHPDADRLSVCMVDIGDGRAAQIVCGAPNVARRPDGRGGAPRRGDARRHGAEGGQAARRRVARDDPGRGRAGDRHRARGIMVLDGRRSRPARRWRRCCRSPPTCSSSRSRPTGPTASASTASRARSTPRPARRCARRRGARTRRTPRRPVDGVEVVVECPELCPRFTARVFEDVTIGPRPPWLKARLMAAGQRPISNVVDITNYVMLLTGQPLHAFDLDRVAGAAADRAPGARGRDRSRRSTARRARSTPTWC